jgi:hypothetical protein
MGTTLTGTTPQDTYDSLIKVTDNGPLSGTLKALSDGLGNDSTLSLSTTAASIAGTLAVTGNVTIDTTTLVVDAAGNRVIMGAASALQGDSLEVHAKGDAGAISLFGRASDNSSVIAFRSNGSITQKAALVGNDSGLGLLTGTTQRVLIDTSGNVGIGTNAPLERLVVSGGALQVTGALSSLDRASSSAVDFFSGGSRIFSIGANSATHGNITFITSTTTTNLERATITSDGYLRLTSNSGGIQFNGDTAAANALDDYEEGTWTMGVSFGGAAVGVTYAANTGTYTKIGRQVTVNGYLALSSKGSSAGAAVITGLPFTIQNSQNALTASSTCLFSVSFANQHQSFGRNNSTIIDLQEVTEAGVATTLTDANFANNSEIILSLTYFV